MKLSEEVVTQANATLKELRLRGADIRLEDLFEECFKSLKSDYWERQLDRFTPDEHLLTLATENPEAKQFLIQQARRALEMVKKGEPLIKDRKKPGPKAKTGEA